MHRALQRQIKRNLGIESVEQLAVLRARAEAGGADPAIVALLDALPGFLARVGAAYEANDRDLDLRSRSLELSSEELSGVNAALRGELHARRRAIASLHAAVVSLLEPGDGATPMADADVESLSELVQQLVAQRADGRRRLDNLIFALDQHAIVSTTDIEGRITYANDRFCAISGYTRDELLGCNHRILRSGRHPDSYYRAMWHEIASGRVWNGEICNRGKDGSEYWVAATIVPMLGADGLPREYIAIRTDITGQKRAERELAVSRDAAEAANRAKSEFLANMSHEIRTPMNGVIGMTDLALDTDLTDEQREYLQIVKSSSAALLAVINDILDFSKIEAGQLSIENIPFEFRRTLAELLKPLAVRAHEKNLELIAEVAADVPHRTFGDPGRLRQVLINLVGNAIKFTPQGSVYVGVTSERADEVYAHLRIVVRDTGVGIPRDKVEHVFEAFTQADSSTTRRFGGTGLGLSISRRLAHLMGGDLAVSSEVGMGSEFVFSVRFGVDHSVPRPLPGPDLAGQVVLVVEDSPINREVLVRMLTRRGMTAHAFDGGPSAQRWLAENPRPALIVTDVQMPMMDGYGLAAWLREQPATATIPIIVLSSGATRGDAQRCRALGINAFFPKPVSEDELLDGVAAVLGTAGSQPGASLVTRHALRERQGALHVLLVEDHPVNQRLAARMLDRWGYSHVLAVNGKDALDRLAAERFDVCLMDMQMPVMGGIECTRHIRSREREGNLPRLPIIAMTANAMQGDRERCLEAGMDDYIAKPIKIPELEAKLRCYVAAPQAPVMASIPLGAADVSSAAGGSDTVDHAAGLARIDAEICEIIGPPFLDSYRADIDAMTTAVARADFDTAHRLAHSLKGTLAAFGADALAQRAYAIETAAGERSASVAELLHGLDVAIEGLAEELRRWLKARADGATA